ncbi:PREDICTED: GDSL esterase/lipase ESM1-like [Tarenaya hassleriana]|uniref:GDSL esterase/lipase ESM1-like n=1 Tax=Tarenaya hassleriana TaxID=28532 RepID=UPI00053C29D7|nr:PREDICTED: GDSL esterase/lipase ESM1-like [Tarenaya hassleriana]
MATNGDNIIKMLGLLITVITFVNHGVNRARGQGVKETGLFPFGDSYYDVGNKQFLTNDFLPSSTWPYGISSDKPNGRFSDGRIVPDFIAAFMNIPNPIPPALKPNADFSHGAGFAVADASVLGNSSETMTFPEQVTKFGDMKSNWNDTFLRESLFLIQIGTEDYLNFIKGTDADVTKQQAFVAVVIGRIKSGLSLLYMLGARKFGYQTLAPLGCLPIVRQEHQLTGDACYEKLNELAKQHNEKIRPMLESLAKQFTGFQYTVLDFYGALSRRILPADHASNIFNRYRFANTIDACCGIGSHNAYGCGSIIVHSKLCEYQRAYLFYDGKHNSEKANEEIAHLFFGADPDIVGPMTLRELLVFPPNASMLEF